MRAIDAAAGDDRIKAVVLDLTQFLGGGQVHLQDIGAAMDRFRAADKPVLTYAVGYADDGMMLAAHASEVWIDPLGGAVIAGPGGERLYYAGLLDKLNVNARVYRVGKYKSAVEPFIRSDMSPEARENYTALYGALWEEWQANVKKARPAIEHRSGHQQPGRMGRSGQWRSGHRRPRPPGLVDKLGSYAEFGDAVAKIAGDHSWDETPGTFAATDLEPWLADIGYDTPGKAIGVVTIAGEIVDGDAGPGTAGGTRIAELLDDALDDDLAALVVRVDSPGGSVLASEEIRRGILRHKAKGIPIVVSMANVAASGGYWVSTPADAHLCRARNDHRVHRHLRRHPDFRTGRGEIRRQFRWRAHHAAVRSTRSDRRFHAGNRTHPAVGHRGRLSRFHRPGRRIAQDDCGAGRCRGPGPRLGWRHGAPDRTGRSVWRTWTMRWPMRRSRPNCPMANGTHSFLGGDVDPLSVHLARHDVGRRSTIGIEQARRAGDMFGMVAHASNRRWADGWRPTWTVCWARAGCRPIASNAPPRPRATRFRQPMMAGWRGWLGILDRLTSMRMAALRTVIRFALIKRVAHGRGAPLSRPFEQ